MEDLSNATTFLEYFDLYEQCHFFFFQEKDE
jgi:hypothetical protein